MSVYEKQLQRPDGCEEIRVNASLGLRPLQRYGAGRQTVSKKVVTMTTPAEVGAIPPPPKQPRPPKSQRKAQLDTGSFRPPARPPHGGPPARGPPADDAATLAGDGVLPTKPVGETRGRAPPRRRLRARFVAVWAVVRLSRLGGEPLAPEEQREYEEAYARQAAEGNRLADARGVRGLLGECGVPEDTAGDLLRRVGFTAGGPAVTLPQFLHLMRLGKRRAQLRGTRASFLEAFMTFAPTAHDAGDASPAAISSDAARAWLQSAKDIGVAVDATPFALLLAGGRRKSASMGSVGTFEEEEEEEEAHAHAISYEDFERLLSDGSAAACDATAASDDGFAVSQSMGSFPTGVEFRKDDGAPSPRGARSSQVGWRHGSLAMRFGNRPGHRDSTVGLIPGIRRNSSSYTRHHEHLTALVSIRKRLAKVAQQVESTELPSARETRRSRAAYVRAGGGHDDDADPADTIGTAVTPQDSPRAVERGRQQQAPPAPATAAARPTAGRAAGLGDTAGTTLSSGGHLARLPYPFPEGPLLLMPKEYRQRVVARPPTLHRDAETRMLSELTNGAVLQPSHVVAYAIHESQQHWQQPLLDALSQPLPPIPPPQRREPRGPLKLNRPENVTVPYLRPSFHTKRDTTVRSVKLASVSAVGSRRRGGGRGGGKRGREREAGRKPREPRPPAAASTLPTDTPSPITCSQLLNASAPEPPLA